MMTERRRSYLRLFWFFSFLCLSKSGRTFVFESSTRRVNCCKEGKSGARKKKKASGRKNERWEWDVIAANRSKADGVDDGHW